MIDSAGFSVLGSAAIYFACGTALIRCAGFLGRRCWTTCLTYGRPVHRLSYLEASAGVLEGCPRGTVDQGTRRKVCQRQLSVVGD
jgi:hypothetical protein